MCEELHSIAQYIHICIQRCVNIYIYSIVFLTDALPGTYS